MEKIEFPTFIYLEGTAEPVLIKEEKELNEIKVKWFDSPAKCKMEEKKEVKKELKPKPKK